MALMFLKVYDYMIFVNYYKDYCTRTMNLDTNKELTMLTFLTNNYYSFDIFIYLFQWCG